MKNTHRRHWFIEAWVERHWIISSLLIFGTLVAIVVIVDHLLGNSPTPLNYWPSWSELKQEM